MCRLLACLSRTECALHAALPPGLLTDFSALSAEHKDGWGLAWHTAGGILVARAASTAAQDERYHAALASTVTDAALVHLRLATPGLPVCAANTHPFLRDGIAFTHNGYAGPMAALDALAGRDAAPLGGTDSERYFLAVLALIRTGAGPAEALHATARRLMALEHTTSANAMLLTGDALHVVCAYRPGSQGAGRPADYFELGYRADPDTVVVASSGVARDGWTALPNGSVLTVARSSLERSVCG